MDGHDRLGRVLRSLWNGVSSGQSEETARPSDRTLRSYYGEIDAFVPSPPGDGGLCDPTHGPPPVVVERVPDSPLPVEAVAVEVSDDFYEIPPELYAVLEPHVPELRERFNRRGLHSELLVRLRGIDDRTLRFGKTSYYRSFLTNFCPDYEAGNGETIRDLTRRLLLDADGGLRRIERSPFSNHLGGGGLVISRDGRVLLPVRTHDVAISRGRMGLTFSGSMNYRSPDATLWAMFSEELYEEVGVGDGDVRDAYYLGVTRNMRWLGKPSVLGAVICESDVRFADVSDENRTAVEFDLDLDYDVTDVSDVVRRDTVDALVGALDDYLGGRRVAPSANLVSVLSLLDERANSTRR